MKIRGFNTKDRTLIVAEIGNNHEGSFSLAKKMIKSAKNCGADAVKFQTINPDKLIENRNMVRLNQLKKYQLTTSQFIKLKKYSDSLDIIFLSTPFDIKNVDNLNPLVPAFKISSGDNDYYDLIKKILLKKKPILISTGMTSLRDVSNLIKFIKKNNQFKSDIYDNLTLLHCVSMYPTDLEKSDIYKINSLKKFKCTVGYSDHTLGIEACLIAVMKGAKVIEKHFTINKNYSKFRDHKLSANPREFKLMVKLIRNIEIILKAEGNKKNNVIDKNIDYRRSARYSRNIKSGAKINEKSIKWVRPGNGIKNIDIKKIIGKKLRLNVLENQLIELKHLF
tara:strand:- start:118 stop:1125 length:1008 start_codon:yes stop_codon:yes gene_type:complete